MHSHFKIYKPYGIISQFSSNDARQLRKKRFLTEIGTFPKGTMPIGRLDEKSEGLLLLTTDGKLSDTINTAGVEKEYCVQLDGLITSKAIEQLKKGIDIGINGKKYRTKPCNVLQNKFLPNFPERPKKIRDDRHGPTSWIQITLKEGKFRQVRKMTSAVGFPTLRLIRVRIGKESIDAMRPGDVQPLQFISY